MFDGRIMSRHQVCLGQLFPLNELSCGKLVCLLFSSMANKELRQCVTCTYFFSPFITVSIHCAPEMSEIDCIGRIESFWPKFVRGW